jgi:Haem-binding domain
MKKLPGLLAGFALMLLLLAQLVPYGKDQPNPPVLQDAPWISAQARQIAVRSCYDCHSNETVWPWYSRVAPASWLVFKDVVEGRGELNFSEWGHGEQEVEEIGEVILEGEMPPRQYLLTHPDARLTPADKTLLSRGLPGIETEHEQDDD